MLLDPDAIPVEYDYRGKPKYTTTVTKVVANECRTGRIVDMIIDFASKGRKVLVLSEYIKHLRNIKKRITEEVKKIKEKPGVLKMKKGYLESLDFTYDLYIGEMKADAREATEAKDVILGTYKLASVGMDIPKLNTLILASPRKEIEQSVGRILRKDKSAKVQHKPLIVDIIDNHGIFTNQANIRKQFYKKYGYTIEHVQMLPDGHIKSRRIVSTVTPNDMSLLNVPGKAPKEVPKTTIGKTISKQMSKPKKAKIVEYDEDLDSEEPVKGCIIEDDSE